MSFLKTGGLTIAFMFAADMVFAYGTGVMGVHSWLVESGQAFGEAAGIPEFFNPDAMEHAGHDHGDLPLGLGDEFSQANPFDCEHGHWHGGEWSCEDHGPSLPDNFSDEPEGFGFGTS